VASEMILTVYGENWAPAIILIQILGITGAFQSLGTTIGIVLLSQGRSDISFKFNLFLLINLIIAIIIGVNWGIVGVSYGVTIVSFYSFWISMYITGKVINMSLINLIEYLKKPFLYTLFMMIVVYSFKYYLVVPNIEEIPLQLFINITIGIISYVSIFLAFDRKKYLNMLNKMKRIST